MVARHAARGFTLIEVLVALVITAIGLLGVLKMTGLAYSSTSVASTRSLAALEASSLAASMHSNRAYWGAGLAPAVTTVTGATISDATLATVIDCTTQGGATPTPVCTPAQVAAYDLQRWAAALQAIIPNPVSTISCTINVTVPVNCTIQISWGENAVAINKQGTGYTATAATFNVPTYILNVEP